MKKLFTILGIAVAVLLSQQTFAQIDHEEVIDENPTGGGTGPFVPGNSDEVNEGYIRLWREQGGSSDQVYYCGFSGNSTFSIGFYYGGAYFMDGQEVHPNDEARSLTIQGALAGRVIEVYDDPNASQSDDWTEIIVKQNIPSSARYTVGNLEHSYEDPYVKVTYHGVNGLLGKVSHFKSY